MKTIDLRENIESQERIRFAEISKIIYKSKKAVALTGAGVSCNAGIPDFRSNNGLYDIAKRKNPKMVVKGQDLFDISIFRDEMTLSYFCTFMEALYNSSLLAKPTETHLFLKLLKDRKKLLRCYTQNIDCIESKIGLKTGINTNDLEGKRSSFIKKWQDLDVVQLHGSLHHLTCTVCFHNFEWNPSYKEQLAQGINPDCENCVMKYQERLYLGKRITGNMGILRPNIVLYGENHPHAEVLATGLNKDISLKPDLLLIMGTSLKVEGVKKLVKLLASSVHRKGGKVIFVNKTPVSQALWCNIIDYEILCDCDDFIHLLKYEIPDLFLTQEQLDSEKLNQRILTPPTTPEKFKEKIKCEDTTGIVASYSQVFVKQEDESESLVKSEHDEMLRLSIKSEKKNSVDNASKVKKPVRKRRKTTA